MPSADTASSLHVDSLIERIRPEVRNDHAYIVSHPPNIEVKLNQNESPYDLPAHLKQELADELLRTELNRYPSEQPYELRDALADHLGVSPEMLLLGNGSNELTYTFGLTLLEKGTPVVLPTPMFALYEKVANLHGADLTSVPPREDLSFDTDAIVRAIEQVDPAITVVTTPNNPTGLTMSLDEIERVLSAASGFVVVDEAYYEFLEGKTAQSLLDDHPNLIIVRTFSKAAGLAGMRLGYMLGHPAIMQEILKARLPFMIDRVAEASGLLLLKHRELISERVRSMKKSIRELVTRLRGMHGVDVVPTEANFAIFRTPVDPPVLLDALAEDGVLVRNMQGYPELQGYLRVNAGTEKENNQFLTALNGALTNQGLVA